VEYRFCVRIALFFPTLHKISIIDSNVAPYSEVSMVSILLFLIVENYKLRRP
jgi:hypothetical protein